MNYSTELSHLEQLVKNVPVEDLFSYFDSLGLEQDADGIYYIQAWDADGTYDVCVFKCFKDSERAYFEY